MKIGVSTWLLLTTLQTLPVPQAQELVEQRLVETLVGGVLSVGIAAHAPSNLSWPAGLVVVARHDSGSRTKLAFEFFEPKEAVIATLRSHFVGLGWKEAGIEDPSGDLFFCAAGSRRLRFDLPELEKSVQVGVVDVSLFDLRCTSEFVDRANLSSETVNLLNVPESCTRGGGHGGTGPGHYDWSQNARCPNVVDLLAMAEAVKRSAITAGWSLLGEITDEGTVVTTWELQADTRDRFHGTLLVSHTVDEPVNSGETSYTLMLRLDRLPLQASDVPIEE